VTVLVVLAAFIVGVLVGAGVAIWLYARMIDRITSEGAGQ